MNVNGRTAAVWDDRWVRFRMALKIRGVEPGHHDYYRGWVLKWLLKGSVIHIDIFLVLREKVWDL
jgi:hypothetical protein